MNAYLAGMGVLLWALSAASPISQPTSDRAALERELGRARAKWNGRRPANYEFVLSVPRNVTWWEREFGIYRVTGETVTAVKPLTGPPAPLFKDHTTIDALFDLVAGRISTSPSSTSPSYEQEVGYVRGFYSRDRPDISFDVPVWRAFSDSADLREPFALIQHVNHCAFFREPTDTRQCPTYAIAIWGDGTVVYDGDSGVRTLGRRQHQVGQDAVRDLSSAISTSGFFTSAGEEYHSVATASGMMTTINHSTEKWITIRADGKYKTVHDFYGAPDSIKMLEAAIERVADSRRYTGRAENASSQVTK